MSLLLLAPQHPLGLSAGTFSCVYDFKWAIIRFNVGLDCYFTGIMFVNVCRGTSLQPVSARFSTSRDCFEMLFMVPADPRSEPLNVGINRASQERVAGATAASASPLRGVQVSLQLIRWKLAIWLQRPALRCLSVYLVGRRRGGGRWDAKCK